MAESSKEEKSSNKIQIVKIIILAISGILAFFALILPQSYSQTSYPMEIGDVASEDILAPYSLTYESEVLTEEAQQEAAASVDPIYLPTDPSIGRRQVEQLRTVLYYMTTVRQDGYASQEEKINDIQTIEGLNLSEDMVKAILQLNETRWDDIQSEATDVLEQIMRNTIRDSDIYSAKRNIASLVDFSFPEEQSTIVVELVEPFIVPNSLYSEEQTVTAIEEAKQAVDPVIRSFIAGETIVRRGEIVRGRDWEALKRYGLIQPNDRMKEILGAGILTLLISIMVGLYFTNQQENMDYSIKALILIAVTFLLFLSIARFIIIDRTILPYVFPLAAFGLTLFIIFNFEVAALFSVILGIMTAYGLSRGFDLTIFYMLPTFVGMLAIGKARRISAFLGSGITIGVAGIAIILGYRLPDPLTDWIGIATLSGASIINGVGAAALTLLLQYIFSHILGTTTALQLLDISRPDHPLLQEILRNAPGTYQHSLQVANLAEQAAEAIGADGLLVRVGAIFHDCGKTKNPQYFIENQVQEELNTHDDIDPFVSAETIINHVKDGVEMAKKHNLPKRIIDFIREHHGTMYTHYQYTQALKRADDPESVDKEQFTYPGPRPQSRETALLMLADGTEARARSEVPKDEEELRSLIETVFDFYEENNQLDDTNLTLKDLEKGSYHPRVRYPSLETSSTKAETSYSEPTKKAT